MVMNSSRKRSFGTLRKLPSGRFQARFTGHDGLRRTAPMTFATKADANAWLATQESDLVRESWKAPGHARITLGEFGRDWIDQRRIKPSTRERYRSAWNLHIEPRIGSLMMGIVRWKGPNALGDGLPDPLILVRMRVRQIRSSVRAVEALR